MPWWRRAAAICKCGRKEFSSAHPPPVNSCRPAVDVLFNSLADSSLASRTAAVLLTGMGRDGAEGLAALRRAGAHTIVQDEISSVIFGMPKAAIDIGAAMQILPLTEISPVLLSLLRPS